MKYIFFRIAVVILFLSSCSSSMTPTEVKQTLPTLTTSIYYDQIQSAEAIKSNKCRMLIKGRSYVAPIGLTVKNDLKNAAKGIDEWVQTDGGNAFVLINYKWLTVDQNGSTQLHVDFDTMKCQ